MKKLKTNTGTGSYTGNVKLTLKKGSKPYKVIKQHNQGTIDFFVYMLDAIKGYLLPNSQPAKVKLIYDDFTSRYGVLFDSITDAAPATGSTEESPKAVITYKFFIPETIVESGTITGLQLESASGTVYAIVTIDPVEISSNTNIELEWSLYISNK